VYAARPPAGASLPGKHLSVWLDTTAPRPARPALERDLRVDVAVVGGGITGLTTALLAARSGMSVALIDQNSLASGTTGHSTAKVTSQHGLTYGVVKLMHGGGAARRYGQSMEAAKERIAAFVDEGIDCDFRRKPAYVYAESRFQRSLVEREASAARDAGLPATLVDGVELPFETRGAVRFDDQAEFDAAGYVFGLARLLEEAGGEIYEQTQAKHVHGGEPCRVETDRAEIAADHVVVATLMPFLDRGGLFARAFPSRSYVVTARTSGRPLEGMYINAGSPTRSLRSVPHAGEELLMVGGESHHTGSGKAQDERYEKLIEFAHRHWPVESIEHRWSSQDYSPDDQIPYIGRLNPFTHRIWVATGMKKWGITAGTLAGMLLTDAMNGRDNDWAGLYSTTRFRPLQEAPRLALENGRVGMRFFTDRLMDRGGRDIQDLAPGEGDIVSAGGQKVAGYRDGEGALHAVSTRCTHLYCQVKWNAAETSWDCPCHGSRFAVDGEVLSGPAVDPLPRRPTA
jgi:glycine/D-amino acid oxidase-like deaminating enzyme/nitrite reductase/ring-hydroxylating ferredoxin subunit